MTLSPVMLSASETSWDSSPNGSEWHLPVMLSDSETSWDSSHNGWEWQLPVMLSDSEISWDSSPNGSEWHLPVMLSECETSKKTSDDFKSSDVCTKMKILRLTAQKDDYFPYLLEGGEIFYHPRMNSWAIIFEIMIWLFVIFFLSPSLRKRGGLGVSSWLDSSLCGSEGHRSITLSYSETFCFYFNVLSIFPSQINLFNK